MSRLSHAGLCHDPQTASDVQDPETCPVCKATRYFNPDISFLINPECYHRMCQGCVSRIFKDGPAQCPYALCNKTLRQRGFKEAYFTDLKIQREVDIRKRVDAVFNKNEDDFESLDAYNEYLETVECLTSDLVDGNDADKKKAEAQLAKYEGEHKAEIEMNRRLAREGEDARRKRLAAEEEAARQRRLQDWEDEAAEKADAARFREEMLDGLTAAESGKAGEAMDKIMLKKRGQQKKNAILDAATAPSSLSIRGLREKTKPVAPVDEGPYDPYGGLDLRTTRIDLTDEKMGEYRNPLVDVARTKDEYKAGGYDLGEYFSRAMFEAFAGLGVFIEDDMVDRGVPTQGAALAAVSGQTGGSMDVDV
jgi:CDK-activating kinase assembly factor MAT1